MKRDEILHEAERLIMHDRNAQYGEPVDVFRTIADLWAAYLGRPVNPADAAVMVALVKIARLKGNPEHLDSWVDLAGYAAVGGELAT